MKHAKKLQISLMNEQDKNEIISWQDRFDGTAGFEAIRHFILEDVQNYTLADALRINFEQFPIGDDERQFLFVQKDKSGEIVAWMLCDCIDMTSRSPELFIQYIAVHPLHQHKGYGKALASEIFLSPKKYIGVQPKKYFAYIDDTNIPSRDFFKQFGFNFRRMTNTYSRAFTTEPSLNKGQQSLGE